MTKMHLCFFPVNNAWAFVFGDDIRTATPISLHMFPLFYRTKGHALEAARHRGLYVDLATNKVSVE
jgi:hypothetical protein